MLMGYFHHSKQFLHPDSTKWNYQWGKINYCPEGEGKTKQQIVTAVPGSLWTGHHRETGGSIKKGRKSWVNAEKVCPVSKEIHPYTQGSDERQRWPSAQTILLYHMAWYSKVLLRWPCIVSHLFKIQPITLTCLRGGWERNENLRTLEVVDSWVLPPSIALPDTQRELQTLSAITDTWEKGLCFLSACWTHSL